MPNGTDDKATYEVLHGGLTGLVDPFQELENEVCVAVDDGHADVVVILILKRTMERE